MVTIRERKSVRNPNYKRFYEFSSHESRICSACPAKTGEGAWNAVLSRVRGVPVHTNWPSDGSVHISSVFICESPSNREFSHGFPTVGRTGQQIFKTWSKSLLVEGWLDQLDNDVYRTNLVRCQADAGLQKRVDREKQQRVKAAAPRCIRHLEAEIEAIAACSCEASIEFTVAVGTGLQDWAYQIRELIRISCDQAKKPHTIQTVGHLSAKSLEVMAE